MSPYAKFKLSNSHHALRPAASTPPKLSLPLKLKPPDPSDFPTPPLQTPAAIPFRWEEVPGRPRTILTNIKSTSTGSEHKPKSVRSLDLPPRLTSTPSPTVTFLDGPCNRTLSSTWSFRKLTGRSEGGAGIKKLVIESCKMKKIIRTSSPAEYGIRSSWRWGSGSAKVNKDEEEVGDDDGGGRSSDFKIFEFCDEHYHNEAGSVTEDVNEIISVKVKVKRKGSFFNKRSHFWARVQESVHGSLKQVAVPWKNSRRAWLR